MRNLGLSIFRERAVEKYIRRQEQHVILRLASPPTFVFLWILLLLSLAAATLVGFIQVPIVVISQSFATISSFNYGAKQYQRVKKILGITIMWTTIISLIAFIPMMFFPRYFLNIFSSDPALIEMGILPLRILIIFFPLVGMHMVSASFFQSLGKVVQSLLIILTKQFLLLIPAIYLLPKIFGLNGVWLSMPAADFLSLSIAGIFIFYEMRVFNRKAALGALEVN